MRDDALDRRAQGRVGEWDRWDGVEREELLVVGSGGLAGFGASEGYGTRRESVGDEGRIQPGKYRRHCNMRM